MKSEIYLYGEGRPSPVSLHVPEDGLIRDVLIAAELAGLLPPNVDVKEILVFVVEEDEPHAHDKPVKHPHKKRQRFHFHRCRKIDVTIKFNQGAHSHSFPPGTPVRKVLQWALHEFKLTGADAQNKELRTGGESDQAMLDDSPIGSYTHCPKCELGAYLADIVQVQG